MNTLVLSLVSALALISATASADTGTAGATAEGSSGISGTTVTMPEETVTTDSRLQSEVHPGAARASDSSGRPPLDSESRAHLSGVSVGPVGTSRGTAGGSTLSVRAATSKPRRDSHHEKGTQSRKRH